MTTIMISPVNSPKDTGRIGLLNPTFKYVNAASTDIRKTFDRIRQEQANEQRHDRRNPLCAKQSS